MNMIVVIAVISINFASVSATYGNKLNQYFDSYYNYYYHTVEGADTWLELDQYETDLFDVMWNKNDYWNKEDIIEAFDGTKIGMKCNSGYYNNADLCVCEVFRTGKKYQCRQYIENENAYKDYNNYYHDYSDNYRDADEMMVNDIASSANTAVLQYIDAQMQASAVYNNFAQDDRSANSIMVKYGAIHFTSPVDAGAAAKKGDFVHITIQEDTLAFITWAMAQAAVNQQNFENWHEWQHAVPKKIENDPDVMAMFHYFNLIKTKPDKKSFWKAIDGRKPPKNRHFRYNPRYNPHSKKKTCSNYIRKCFGSL
eukprot:503317_1